MSTILTGIRVNDQIHIGNYLGAIKPMAKLSKHLGDGDKMFMFVPDLHSITTQDENEDIYGLTLDNVRTSLAAGVSSDANNVYMYRQSAIPAHTELAWVLSCYAYFGEANRMTQFKDKSAKFGQRSISVALFNYPILMAADILLYGADYIPVGDDQKQHLELARTIAQRFNSRYGEVFTVPKPWNQQLGYAKRDISLRIRSLTNPKKKMSKSDNDAKSKILLSDKPEVAVKKIMSAQTDSLKKIGIDFDKQPGVSNLIFIAAYLSDMKPSEVERNWKNSQNYGEFKSYVAGVVYDFLEDFQNDYSNVKTKKVEDVLMSGEANASKVASETISRVYKAIGLRRQ